MVTPESVTTGSGKVDSASSSRLLVSSRARLTASSISWRKSSFTISLRNASARAHKHRGGWIWGPRICSGHTWSRRPRGRRPTLPRGFLCLSMVVPTCEGWGSGLGGGFEEGSPFPPQPRLFCVSRLCRLPGPSASVVSRPLRQNFSVTKTCWPVASAWRRSSSARASALAPSLRAADSPVRCLPALRHSNDSPPVLHSSHVCRVCLPVTALHHVLLSAAFPSQPQRTLACTPAYSFALRHVLSSSHHSHARRCHPRARCCCPRASGGL